MVSFSSMALCDHKLQIWRKTLNGIRLLATLSRSIPIQARRQLFRTGTAIGSLRVRKCEQGRGIWGHAPPPSPQVKFYKIWHSEIASEAMFGPKKLPNRLSDTIQTLWHKLVSLKYLHWSICSWTIIPRADQYFLKIIVRWIKISGNFSPPDQNFRRTKISVTGLCKFTFTIISSSKHAKSGLSTMLYLEWLQQCWMKYMYNPTSHL